MHKMGFMDDMNWYRNINTGLDAVIKVNRSLSLHETIEGGLAAAMAKINTYDQPYRTLRSIAESHSSYNKMQNGLDKMMKATTGLAFTEPKYKNLLFDSMQKQLGLATSINMANKKSYRTLMDIAFDMNKAVPKQNMTLMDAMFKINRNIPNSLHSTAFNIFQKQNALFDHLRKQPWEMGTPILVQAAALSQHAGVVSKSFLSDIITNRQWDELEESGRTFDWIEGIVSDLFDKRIDIEQFYDRSAEFISAVSGISSTEKAKNIREKIMYFLGIIGFIITVYALYASTTHAETAPIIININNGRTIDDFKRDTLTRMQQMIPTSYDQRISTCNVNLHFKPLKKSKILVKVKEGQIVKVLEIHHKWLFVTFTDERREDIHSGWVLKKYFEEF